MNQVHTSTDSIAQVKLYRYRWVILLIFCLYSSINFLQFLQYSSISNLMRKYYGVGSFLMDLTGLVFMITFVIFCLPVNYLIEKYDLRATAIASSGLTAVGNLVKLSSANPDRFDVVIVSQTLCGIAQVFMLTIPSKLASVWFGHDEVSTACAVAILGTQIGIGIGTILSPSVVRESDDTERIGDDLFTLMIYNAAFTCLMFVLVLIFFRAKPPLPPSRSQVQLLTEESIESRTAILTTCRQLLKNRDYLFILGIFGIANGIYTAEGVLLNSIYLNYFPESTSDIGIVLVSCVISGGCVGSVVFGYVLDRTHKFKLISFISIFCSAIAFIPAIYSLEYKWKMAAYFSLPLSSFFLGSTLAISFEFVTEITYPLPEVVSCSVLNATVYLFAIVFTFLFEILIEQLGYLSTLYVIFGLLVLSSLLTFFLAPRLRRREANLNLTAQ